MAETDEQKATRLADLIVDRFKANGVCTDDDLFQAGFTTDDLRQYGHRARNLAALDLARIEKKSREAELLPLKETVA